MRDLFSEDPERFDAFHTRHEGLLFDYSKHCITEETKALLFDLTKACDIDGKREQMFSGAKINSTENRAALHTALRKPQSGALEVDGQDTTALIHDALKRIKAFSDKIRNGDTITDIVTIGIGGSVTGPEMVCEALKPFSKRDINIHFVSNIDGSHIAETLRNLKPKTTLFIVASKTFTTQETMTNAEMAKKWLTDSLGENAVNEHFVAITADDKKAKAFGIEPDHIFPLWDWVGGRYSLWSSIGLPICISIGFDNFRKLLDGAHSMDKHFQEAPLEHNIPVIMALLGIWHINFCSSHAHAILPYDQYLSRLPVYVRQLDMESNGKNTDREGHKIDYATSPVVFGEPGTIGQHAFYQMLHQGSEIIPCDFIIAAETQNPIGDHHQKLVANAIGQSQALMLGQSDNEPHKTFDGNRPSSTILLDRLDPYHLGMLLALYEHKIFVQGIIWNLNSFDQWGVELGKALAQKVLSILSKDNGKDLDSSTRGLIESIKAHEKT